jgi:hypothetical protein
MKETQKSYINPQVLLQFLSTTSMQESLKACVVSGKTKLQFDPMMFIREAQKTASRRFFATGGRIENLEIIIDILDHLFDEEVT